MKKILALFIFAAVLCISFRSAESAQSSKMAFWNVQRKGANMQNAKPRPEYWRAAGSLGLDYEMGTSEKDPPGYWQAVERGEDPETLKHRVDSSLWRVLKREFH